MLESAQINETTPPAISQCAVAAWKTGPATLQLQLGLIREAAQGLLNQLQPLGREQPNGGEKTASLYDEVRRFEIQLISNALFQTRGHQKKAARLLGIKATTLNAKIKRYKMLPFSEGWSFSETGAAVDYQVEG